MESHFLATGASEVEGATLQALVAIEACLTPSDAWQLHL
jgi:hypothetical protein